MSLVHPWVKLGWVKDDGSSHPIEYFIAVH